MSSLPDYVVINNESQSQDLRNVLRRPAETVSFPLSPEDQKVVEQLSGKFDAEENCAGLAAPQIGYGRRIIIFATPDDERLRKWRPDFEQTMPRTIWVNPSYEPAEEATTTDYEGCFSVHDQAGPVARFKHIRYRAFLTDGKQVTGEATGFLARIIQHEVDHLNGILCIDKVPKGELKTVEEYQRMRMDAMAREESEA